MARCLLSGWLDGRPGAQVPGNDEFREIPGITLFLTFPLQDVSPGCVLGIGLSLPV